MTSFVNDMQGTCNGFPRVFSLNKLDDINLWPLIRESLIRSQNLISLYCSHQSVTFAAHQIIIGGEVCNTGHDWACAGGWVDSTDVQNDVHAASPTFLIWQIYLPATQFQFDGLTSTSSEIQTYYLFQLSKEANLIKIMLYFLRYPFHRPEDSMHNTMCLTHHTCIEKVDNNEPKECLSI